jgi:hypothetical protein
MYKELENLKLATISFAADDSLEQTCNAQKEAVCFSIQQQQKKKELIMVGSTGTVQNDGTLKIKNGGLKEKIVEGPVCKNR